MQVQPLKWKSKKKMLQIKMLPEIIIFPRLVFKLIFNSCFIRQYIQLFDMFGWEHHLASIHLKTELSECPNFRNECPKQVL